MDPMIRKQTYISTLQNKVLKRRAISERTTEAEIIRRAIDSYLKNEMIEEDPLFELIGITDNEPRDGAANHDRYIYEQE